MLTSLNHDLVEFNPCCTACVMFNATRLLFVSIAVMTDELSNLAARRVSMAPFNRANLQSRSMSWRNGSVYWARLEGT